MNPSARSTVRDPCFYPGLWKMWGTNRLRLVVIGSVSSLTKQRRHVLPNPGYLESLFEEDRHHHLKLLAGSKNRSKSAVISTLSNGYELLQEAFLEVDDEATIPLNSVLSAASMVR